MYYPAHVRRSYFCYVLQEAGVWGRIKKTLVKNCFCLCGRNYGNYLAMSYMFVKILYIINTVGQLFMLNVFLGTDYHMFGLHVIQSLLKGIFEV